MYFVLLLWLWCIAYIKTFERLIELWLNGAKTFFFIKIKATLLIVGIAWIDDSNNEQNTIFGVLQEKKKSSNDDAEVTVSKVVTSTTLNISNAELSLVEDEIEKPVKPSE